MNLVVVQVVCECLHDAGEYHEAGADKDADVDVVIGQFLLEKLSFGGQEMSGNVVKYGETQQRFAHILSKL